MCDVFGSSQKKTLIVWFFKTSLISALNPFPFGQAMP